MGNRSPDELPLLRSFSVAVGGMNRHRLFFEEEMAGGNYFFVSEIFGNKLFKIKIKLFLRFFFH